SKEVLIVGLARARKYRGVVPSGSSLAGTARFRSVGKGIGKCVGIGKRVVVGKERWACIADRRPGRRRPGGSSDRASWPPTPVPSHRCTSKRQPTTRD